MQIQKILEKDDTDIEKFYSHQDLDSFCFTEFGLRPYKLGETKKSKIKKIRAFVEELENEKNECK